MSYQQFTRDERIALKAYLQLPLSLRDIARQMQRDVASLSREVTKGGGRTGYTMGAAQKATKVRRKAANQQHRKLGLDVALTQIVIDLLAEHWSPEQIVGRMKLEQYPGTIGFSAIYNYVNPRPELAQLLARKHNKYRKRHGISQREQRRIELEAKRNIAIRPDVVTARTRVGDWEGDTIVGVERKERILTHTERKSGYLLAVKTINGEAEQIRQQTEQAFKPIAKGKRTTVTYDNGSEFAEWEQTERTVKATIYFANAYHSWERGSSENTNGLVRRYFPKGTAFATLKPNLLTKAVKQINHRPRKRHGYKTPYEVFYRVAVRTLI